MSVPYWVEGSIVVLSWGLDAKPFTLDRVFFASNVSAEQIGHGPELAFLLGRNANQGSFRLKAKGPQPPEPRISCTYRIAPPPSPPRDPGAAAPAGTQHKPVQASGGAELHVSAPPLASPQAHGSMAHGSLSAEVSHEPPSPSATGGAGEPPKRSGSAKVIAVGLTFALLCVCGHQLRQASQRARAADVDTQSQLGKPKKVYLQHVDGEETVLSLPTSEVENLQDVLEKVSELGWEASGEQHNPDGLEIWTQDATGHAKRVRANTPFKQILGAHALLARAAKNKNHSTRATMD